MKRICYETAIFPVVMCRRGLARSFTSRTLGPARPYRLAIMARRQTSQLATSIHR